jgi:hypothetical protein
LAIFLLVKTCLEMHPRQDATNEQTSKCASCDCTKPTSPRRDIMASTGMPCWPNNCYFTYVLLRNSVHAKLVNSVITSRIVPYIHGAHTYVTAHDATIRIHRLQGICVIHFSDTCLFIVALTCRQSAAGICPHCAEIWKSARIKQSTI